MKNAPLVTNIIALLIMVSGYFSPIFQQQLIMTGAFALSGALTNWLAIYMIFERIPLIYGSGVILLKFEELRQALKNVIIEQFFNKEHIEKVLKNYLQNSKSSNNTDDDNAEADSDKNNNNQTQNANTQNANIAKISEKIDIDKLFDIMVASALNSKLGDMLSMFGGKDILENMREPFRDKASQELDGILQKLISDVKNDPEAMEELTGFSSANITAHAEEIIDQRLQELTPQMVKNIIHKIIAEHLGWLVIWGGVCGGVIGCAVSFI